jgi:FAD:protein FMN transferase
MVEPLVRRCRAALGTFVEIAAPAGCEAAVEAAFADIAHIHARMSFHDEHSDLAVLRRAPAGAVVRVDPDTVAVLRIAASLYNRSAGLFDVSVGTRLVAMGFLPCPPDITLAQMHGTGANIEIVSDVEVRCSRPMLIDLGGIAKGYAVDHATATLRAAGVSTAVTNAGGDLRVIGTQPVHLRDARGTIGEAIELSDTALATSSNLHSRRRHRWRNVVPHVDGNRKCQPVDHAVHVLAPDCVLADAMTKIALADPVLAELMLHERGGTILRPVGMKRAA